MNIGFVNMTWVDPGTGIETGVDQSLPGAIHRVHEKNIYESAPPVIKKAVEEEKESRFPWWIVVVAGIAAYSTGS